MRHKFRPLQSTVTVTEKLSSFQRQSQGGKNVMWLVLYSTF